VRIGGPRVREGLVKKPPGSDQQGLDASPPALTAVSSGEFSSLRKNIGLCPQGSGKNVMQSPPSTAPSSSNNMSRGPIPAVGALPSEAEKSSLLSNHLQTQLGRLRSCKTNLTDDLKRAELRIQAMRRHEESLREGTREDEDVIAQLPWTSRVSSRLHVTNIGEIHPPEGSRAYEEEARRNARLRAADDKSGKGGGGGGDMRSDMFPSVSAPNAS
jgi:hypothetical protein